MWSSGSKPCSSPGSEACCAVCVAGKYVSANRNGMSRHILIRVNDVRQPEQQQSKSIWFKKQQSAVLESPCRMALIHGIQRAGATQTALKQMAFFYSSTSLQVKLRRNRTRYKGEDYNRVRDPSYMPSVMRQRAAHKRDLFKWTLKLEKKWEGYRTLVCYEAIRDTFEEIGELFGSMPVSKENRNWEAYLKSQGEWENFCKKFLKPQDVAIEWPRPRRHGDYTRSCSSLDSEHEDEDDVWDRDDPTFGAHKHKTESKSATEPVVVTIGERAHRVALGLPPVGSLTMEELKAAFSTSALKWHPDRHNGSSKDMAEEKYRACVNAFRALCLTLISHSHEPSRGGSAGLRVACWTTPELWEFQRSVEEAASACPPQRVPSTR